MKILMVVPHFVPEIGSAAHIYFDLTKAFRERGHEVHVITSYPRMYNLNSQARGACPLDENIEGIMVHRCDHGSKRDSIIRRGIEHFLIPRQYFRTYRRLGKKFDVCLIYIPPLPLYYFAKRLKRRDGTPSIMNYQDFHPQELTDVGVMKNELMIKLMEHIEKSSYINADYITVISGGGIEYIRNKGCTHRRMDLIYNGVQVPEGSRSRTKRDFKKKENIEDKTLVTYAGILSPFQGIDNILNAARGLISKEDIVFYIVGDGMIKNHLEKRIRDEKLTNVRLLPLQPREEYLNIVESSDIALISLDERMRAPCLPGKLSNILAAGRPVIAVVSDDSETAKVVRSGGFGIVVDPTDAQELQDAICKLKEDKSMGELMGSRGLQFLKLNMDVRKNAQKYERLFIELSGKDARPLAPELGLPHQRTQPEGRIREA